MSMGRTALVADDQELSRIALAAILSKRLGCARILEVDTLDRTLDLLGSDLEISLVLIDLDMPGMSPAVSLSAIRGSFPHVKLVVVSGSTRRGDILMALQSGVHGYIRKDATMDEIARALDHVLDGNIFVPASLCEPDWGEESLGFVAAASPFPSLPPFTPRQQDVFRLLAAGTSNKEIAHRLELGEGTVKIHLAALFRLLGVRNRAAAAAIAARRLPIEPVARPRSAGLPR